jgi:hypothetical protein
MTDVVQRFRDLLAAAAARLDLPPGDASHRDPVTWVAQRLGFGGFFERAAGHPPDPATKFLALHQVLLHEGAREASAAWSAAGVTHAVVKGAALLYQLYQPGDREVADIDVLVHPDHRHDALRVLAALGYQAVPEAEQAGPPALRPGTAVRRAAGRQGVTDLYLDLQWALEPVDRLLPRSDLAFPPEIWTALERPNGLPVPRTAHHVALLVHHLVRHDLLHAPGFLDLALLWETGDDIEMAERLCRRLGVSRAFRRIAWVLHVELGLSLPRSVSRPPGRRLRLADWLARVAQGDAAEHRAITLRRAWRRARTADGPLAPVRVLADALVPPAAFLAWRWPEASNLRQAWRLHLGRVAAAVFSGR